MTGDQMTGTPSLRRAVLALLAVVALFATSGCVNLPANTTASVVGNPAKGGSGADVRIWPQAPYRGEPAEQTVEGFLQTAASDPSNLSIARTYLTGEALNTWHQNRVVVFSEVSSPSPPTSTDTSGQVEVGITGTEVATVSDKGVYQQVLEPSKDAPFTFRLSFNPAKGYYQIDRLPNGDFGILLTQEAFRANYAAYYLYYLNQDTPSSSMIPVPDYQRSQTGDAVTAQNLVAALMAGPPDALSGIAGLAPDLDPAGPVTISPDDTASVPIKPQDNCAKQAKTTCELLADELLATFSSLASVSKVMLVDPQGNTLASSSTVGNLASRYHIAAGAVKGPPIYYLDSKTHQVYRYENAGAGSDSTSPAEIGPSNRKYSQLAVGSYAGDTYAAVVDSTGTKLYVSTPGSSKDAQPSYIGHRIVSPTWDALGHLWFLDFFGGAASLYRLDMTQAKPAIEQVALDGDGGTINEISAAPDGRRIAVSYAVSESGTGPEVDSVGVAVVEDNESGLALDLSYGLDEPVVYHWTSVSDVCWHGSQALTVLGSQTPSSPLTVAELNSDGSPVISAADLNPVTFNPPTGTGSIDWTGGALLAATLSGSGAAAVQQIEQYSFTTGAWTDDASGFSPSYVMN